MNIFLSTSFSQKIDQATGQVLDTHKIFVERILASLRSSEGAAVFCAIESEQWRANNTLPEIAVALDLSEIDKADILLALLDDTISAGMQFELGYAVAKGKKVIVAKQSEHELGYFTQGVVSSGLITYLAYDNVAMLVQQLPIALNAPTSEL